MLRYILFIIAVIFCPCLYAQQYEQKAISGLYNDLTWTQNLKPGQAFLLYTVEPAGTLSNAQLVTYNDLKTKNVDFTRYTSGGFYGNFYTTRTEDSSYLNVISLVDSKYFYVNNITSSVDTKILQPIQSQMIEKNLGTIAERARYISLEDSLFTVLPVDFCSFLSPWLLAGIGLFLSLPAIYILYRLIRSGIR